jgi:ABC-type transport system involved in multi-copper enzyme maturation permease subunit
MLFLPVAERELRVRARQPRTYHGRVGIGLTAIAIMMGMIFFRGFSTRGVLMQPELIGKAIFDSAAVLLTLFCLFEGARHTADCLSEETREGTLGLLFLADLRAHEIVIGKLASAALASCYGLLVVLPVLGIPIFMGGVTGGELFRLMLGLAGTQLMAVAAGLWISSRSQHQLMAWVGTAGLILALAFGPALSALSAGFSFTGLLSPLDACWFALEPHWSRAPGRFWWALLAGQGITWLFFGLACRNIQHAWRDQSLGKPHATHAAWWQRLAQWIFQQRRKSSRSPAMLKLLEDNPVAWLALRRGMSSYLLWVVVAAGGAVVFLNPLDPRKAEAAVTWGFVVLFAVLLKFWAAMCACNTFASARRDGSLEVLACTPLTADQIVTGYFTGLRRLFFAPVAAWIGIAFAAPFLGPGTSFQRLDQLWFYSWATLIFNAFLLLDLHAIGWTGLWHGLSRRKAHTALGCTVFQILVLPWACVLIPVLGLLLLILSPFWSLWSLQWAQLQLQHHFHIALTQHAEMPFSWWDIIRKRQRFGPAAPSRTAPAGVSGESD